MPHKKRLCVLGPLHIFIVLNLCTKSQGYINYWHKIHWFTRTIPQQLSSCKTRLDIIVFSVIIKADRLQNWKLPDCSMYVKRVHLCFTFYTKSGIIFMSWWEFLEVVFGRRLLVVAAVAFTETVHRVGLTVTTEQWRIDTVLSLVAATKYVCTRATIRKYRLLDSRLKLQR